MAVVAGTLLPCASPAAGTETRPLAETPETPADEIKTQAIGAQVYLDMAIAAEAPLAADCLKEARKWMNASAADAAADRKQNPQAFRDKDRPRWDFQRNYQVHSIVAGRYVSIVRSDAEYRTGAAHTNYDINTILWDKAAKMRISIRPFFTETGDGGPTLTAMRGALIAALKAGLAAEADRASPAQAPQDNPPQEPQEQWFNDIEPSLLKIGAVTLAPSTDAGKSSGLAFHFPPYHPLFLTGHVAFVPWKTLEPFLSPEGLRIFGGERPRNDEDQKQ
ncbi:MAG: hypothetical protein FWD68_17920 [Alphaproteobacteria bacterium]|nr:hypothetical protein [Alphaproteobacteria bacterium]